MRRAHLPRKLGVARAVTTITSSTFRRAGDTPSASSRVVDQIERVAKPHGRR